MPVVEDAATKAGAFVAERAPEVVRDVVVPRFIEGFEEARGRSREAASSQGLKRRQAAPGSGLALLAALGALLGAPARPPRRSWRFRCCPASLTRAVVLARLLVALLDFSSSAPLSLSGRTRAPWRPASRRKP